MIRKSIELYSKVEIQTSLTEIFKSLTFCIKCLAIKVI